LAPPSRTGPDADRTSSGPRTPNSSDTATDASESARSEP
jgi:hypothetical protein